MQPHAPVDCEPLESVRALHALCYPRPSPGHCYQRISLLREAGITGVFSYGKTQISTPLGPLRVLGKGHSSIVVAVCTSGGPMALKVRRLDSKRLSLAREGLLLERAARHGASPRPHAWSDDFILMDLVPGPSLGESLAVADPRRVAVEALLAARALDTAMILHLEISRPQRHVLFTGTPRFHKAVIVDLDSAVPGECGNASKIAGYLARVFGRSPLKIRGLLRSYKVGGCPERLFRRILDWFRQ